MPLLETDTRLPTSGARAKPVSQSAWYALGLLFVANVCNYMDRMVVAVVLPLIKTDLNLSDTQLGMLTGIVFAVFYAAFGIPIARWADRGTRRTIVALAIAIWSAMTVLCGLAQNFLQLALARFGVGVGEAGCIPPSHSLIADYFPVERRSTAYAIHTTGSTFGVIAGLAIGGIVGELWGWRWAFIVLGAPGLLLALLVYLTMKEPVRGSMDKSTTIGEQPALKEALNYLSQRRSYWHLLVIFSISSFSAAGINTWLPSYYARTFNMGIAEIGVYFGVVFGLGAAAGTLCGGIYADKTGAGDLRRPLLILGTITTLVTFPLTLGMLLAPTASIALAFNFAGCVSGSLTLGPLFTALQSVVGNRHRAMATAVVMFAGALIGIGLGPLLVGLLSDGLAKSFGTDSLRFALMAVSALGMYPFVHLLLALRSLPGDIGMTENESAMVGKS